MGNKSNVNDRTAQRVKRRASRLQVRQRIPSAVGVSSPRAEIKTATPPALPATVRYEIDWAAVTAQVARHVRRRLKSRKPLPHGWDGKKVESHLGLKVAGLLIQQTAEKRLSIPTVIREQADLLFAAFPDMRAQDDRWVAARSKTLTRRGVKNKRRVH